MRFDKRRSAKNGGKSRRLWQKTANNVPPAGNHASDGAFFRRFLAFLGPARPCWQRRPRRELVVRSRTGPIGERSRTCSASSCEVRRFGLLDDTTLKCVLVEIPRALSRFRSFRTGVFRWTETDIVDLAGSQSGAGCLCSSCPLPR